MAKTKAQKVAAEAHRYVDSLRMWKVEHSRHSWAMWVYRHGLSKPFADHVHKVITAIMEGA